MMRVDATAATGDSSNAHGKHVPISTFEIESSDLPAVGIRRNNQQEEDSDEDDDGSVIIDPHAAELGGDLTSAVLGIIKGMVGPAILYLPHGFVAAGFMVALPIMAISTALYLHSSRCLLESWKYESEKQGQLVPQHHPQEEKHPSEEEEIQFQDEPEMATKLKDHQQQNHHRRHMKSLSYPELAYRAFGQKGETMVKVGIALMQSGVCLTYFIFVPHNLHTSLKLLFGWNLSPNVYLFFMTLLQIPLSWVRDIRRFTCTNALANGLILYGLLLCLWFAFSEAIQPLYNAEDAISTSNSTMSTRLLSEGGNYDNHHEFDKSGPIFNVWKHLTHLDPFGEHWILFIGTSVLLFEGSITLLIPLQEAVHPTHSEDQELDDRARFPTIYRKTILGIQVFYVIFGVTCWMSFGDDVNTVLTVSLPPGFLATTVQLAYTVAVLFTFPLQNYPALEITCRSISHSLSTSTYLLNNMPPRIHQWIMERNTIAAGLVCVLAVVALTTMDELDKVVSLMGSLVGCPVAFIIPPMIHATLVPNLSEIRLRMNYAVSLMGSVAMVLASITTILQWRD